MKIHIFFVVFCLIISMGCAVEESVANLKKQALESLQNKNYSQAVTYLEKAVSAESENQELHYLLGQAYRQLLYDDGSKIIDTNPGIARKASKHFRRAIEISPIYQGQKFVVGPYSKIQGIWGAVGMTYLYKGKIDSALAAFKEGKSAGGFYPAIVEYNKNIMASCAKDAIIFTNGDNDTYPMWYLQLVEKYRKDITVLNLSLLNVSWYIKLHKNSYPFGDNNMPLHLTNPEIDDLKYKPWQASEVELPVNADPLSQKEKLRWLMKPTVSDKIIRVQDIMVMEILKANNWARPVYFSTTVSALNKIGLDEYLAFEGLVFKLNVQKEKIALAPLKNNCLNIYSYDGIHDKHSQYITEMQRLLNNYRTGFTRLAISYSQTGQKEEVKKVLEIMKDRLPENLIPYKDNQMEKELEALYREVSERG